MRIAEKLDNHEDSVYFTPPFLILGSSFHYKTRAGSSSSSSTKMMITYWNEALE
jgi:hypothetical protein